MELIAFQRSSGYRSNRGTQWLLASGFWLLASGFWLLASGFWLLASREAIAQDADDEDTQNVLLAQEDNGDGTWSYVLTADLLPTEAVRVGAVEWAYFGQARYSFGTNESDLYEARFDYPAGTTTATDQIYNTRRVDNFGREWRASAIDRAEWQDRLEEMARITSEGDVDLDREIEHEAAAGVGTPYTWWFQQCISGGQNEKGYWDTDDRSKITTTLQARQGTVVTVQSYVGDGWDSDCDYGEVAFCSGVMVGPTWVLTSAHCVTDASGNLLDKVKVFTKGGSDDMPYGNAERRNVIMTYTDLSWAGTNWLLIYLDYAILELNSPFGVDPGEMTISNMSGTGFDDYDLYNVAYPAYGVSSGCTVNPVCIDDEFVNPDHNWKAHAYTSMEDGVSVATTSTLVYTKIDATDGHSGSPIYYCDGGTCSSGETGRVAAPLSGTYYFFPAFYATSGPKGKSFHDWAYGYIDLY